MESNCDRCIHADGVSGYEDGQDMFVCGIEDSLTDEDVECANKNECPYYIPNDAFKPCPICGKDLTAKDIVFVDEEGYLMYDMYPIKDFTDLCNPINATYGNEKYTEEEKQDIIDYYSNKLIDTIDHVIIECSCGYTFTSCAYDFHNKSWFEEFKKEANRRA